MGRRSGDERQLSEEQPFHFPSLISGLPARRIPQAQEIGLFNQLFSLLHRVSADLYPLKNNPRNKKKQEKGRYIYFST